MPLLATIREYFREGNPIILDEGKDLLGCVGSLDKELIIHLDPELRGNEEIYEVLLHEFIHLDKRVETGSVYGYGQPENGTRKESDPIEEDISKEVRELINQNCLAYRVLKEELPAYYTKKPHVE